MNLPDKKSPGDRLYADDINKLAGAIRKINPSAMSREIARLTKNSAVIKIRNSEAATTFNKYHATKISGHALTATAADFFDLIVSAELIDTDCETWAVCLDEIAPGEVGRAVVSGVTIARVNVSDTDHAYVEGSNGSQILASAAETSAGCGQIIALETESTGEQWGVIRFPFGSGGGQQASAFKMIGPMQAEIDATFDMWGGSDADYSDYFNLEASIDLSKTVVIVVDCNYQNLLCQNGGATFRAGIELYDATDTLLNTVWCNSKSGDGSEPGISERTIYVDDWEGVSSGIIVKARIKFTCIARLSCEWASGQATVSAWLGEFDDYDTCRGNQLTWF